MVVRDEELPELDTLQREACPYPVKGGPENKHGKANTLLQVGGCVYVCLGRWVVGGRVVGGGWVGVWVSGWECGRVGEWVGERQGGWVSGRVGGCA